MSVLEWIAALLGVLNIALIVRRSIWNFPVGMIMVGLYAVVFFRARLYSDVLLQVFFFLMQFYGWWLWSRHTGADSRVIVRQMSARQSILSATATTGLFVMLGALMSHYTDAALPWWDASIAALSVMAQLLMSWRKLENWLLWIVADIVGIGVYAAKGLYPTVALYTLFLVMAVTGFVEWRRLCRQQVIDKTPES
jgi:nicotinamide mononucleotide transporter